jgi:hypothetical protein
METPPSSPIGRRIFSLISRGETITYGYVAIILLGIAAAIAVYLVKFVVASFQAQDPFFLTLIALINEILLLLIVMELLRTVTRLLLSPSHEVGIEDLNPFLVIAGISVTRRILTIGAGLSVHETEAHILDAVKFQQAMTELVVSGLIILLVAVSLWLINRPHPKS